MALSPEVAACSSLLVPSSSLSADTPMSLTVFSCPTNAHTGQPTVQKISYAAVDCCPSVETVTFLQPLS